MKHSWLTWMGFSLCLAVVLAALGWISLAAVRLKQAEVETQRQADLEDKVRLSMWRIDSVLAPLVAQESVRPWFCYRPFLPAERVVNPVVPGDRSRAGMSVPSPLLTAVPPHVLVYFQIEPDGRLTSPQVPRGPDRRLAVPRYVTAAAVQRAEQQLAKIALPADRKTLAAILPRRRSEPLEVAGSPILPQPPTQQMAQQIRRAQMQRDVGQGAVEFDGAQHDEQQPGRPVETTGDCLARGTLAANRPQRHLDDAALDRRKLAPGASRDRRRSRVRPGLPVELAGAPAIAPGGDSGSSAGGRPGAGLLAA